MKIEKTTKIIDALKLSKGVKEILQKYNLDCAGCKGAVEDTIEKVAFNNGLDLKMFLNELNNKMD